MGKYSDDEWYLKEKEKYISEYGEIPPHWIVFPDSHPYSIMWRMGAGETFVMVFSNWFEDNYKEEKNRIDFFLKYPPPPRWMETMASYIWEEIPMEDFEKSKYLERIKELGFSGTEKYLSDLEDPKWLA
ncbi:hypothetical protein ATO12_00230 [Aquimarina atlantica]|uniref:Uncharacterized protein n=1 Tax=Aquimarina atlantica TaxID=1317122 RepID=A0A023BYS2_9FLAO|nr:hypothetical protein [Aquimarina atlantica]EZH75237.1 hypothetical protein ATO12_00230 [Aquimarina atlantica]